MEDYEVFRRSGALLRNFVINLYKALGSSKPTSSLASWDPAPNTLPLYRRF